MFRRQRKIDVVASCFETFDRILRGDAAIPFHLHLQIVVRQDAFTQSEDGSHFARVEPVILIAVIYPKLQNSGFAFSNRPAAIDKIFLHVTDLGEMEMGRNAIPIRQDEPREFIRLRFENRLQLMQFHVRSIFLYRNVVKRV